MPRVRASRQPTDQPTVLRATGLPRLGPSDPSGDTEPRAERGDELRRRWEHTARVCRARARWPPQTASRAADWCKWRLGVGPSLVGSAQVDGPFSMAAARRHGHEQPAAPRGRDQAALRCTCASEATESNERGSSKPTVEEGPKRTASTCPWSGRATAIEFAAASLVGGLAITCRSRSVGVEEGAPPWLLAAGELGLIADGGTVGCFAVSVRCV